MAKLKGKVLNAFLELVLRGYTVGRIRELMADQGHNLETIPDAALIVLMREARPGLADRQAEMDADIRKEYGLARKLERIRRLCEAAEAIEGQATLSVKWSAEYRHLLVQIQRELEPLGIEISAGDSWAALLMRIANVGEGDDTATG